MKKERFLDLVCDRLRALGVPEAETDKQRLRINSYLDGLGIDDESEELDYENPDEFAEEIFEIIGSRILEKVSESTVSEDIDEAIPPESSAVLLGIELNNAEDLPDVDTVESGGLREFSENKEENKSIAEEQLPIIDLSLGEDDDDVKIFTPISSRDANNKSASFDLPIIDFSAESISGSAGEAEMQTAPKLNEENDFIIDFAPIDNGTSQQAEDIIIDSDVASSENLEEKKDDDLIISFAPIEKDSKSDDEIKQNEVAAPEALGIPMANEIPQKDELEAISDSFSEEADDYYNEEDIPPQEATREYDLQDLISEDIENALYADEDDDYFDDDDYVKPLGNPVFFWILTAILSPLWIALGASTFVMIPVCYALLLLFMVIYIPLLIILILGGSVAALAETVYSIIKFVKGEIPVGLFELGLGIFAVALVMCLSVLVYRSGTRFVPRAIKHYWKSVKKFLRKIKKLVRRIREVCSI